MAAFVDGTLEVATFWLQAVADSIFPGLLLVAAVALGLRYTSWLNAAGRYVILWSVLAALVVLPAGIIAWRTIDLQELVPVGLTESNTATTTAATNQSVTFHRSPDQTANQFYDHNRGESSIGHTERSSIASPTPGRRFEPAGATLGEILLGLLPISILALWLIGAVMALIRLGLAYRSMRRVLAASVPAPTDIDVRLEHWSGVIGNSRPVRVRVTDSLVSPAATGFRTGTILLPKRLMNQLTAGELDTILLHELTHLSRRDDWCRLGEQFILSLWFFHPLLHWLVRRIDLQREIACDDAVVVHTRRPAAYARTLAKLVEMSNGQAPLALSPGAVLSKKHIFARFAMLLNSKRGRSRPMSRSRLTATVVAVLAAFILALQVPSVVAVPKAEFSLDEVLARIDGSATTSVAQGEEPDYAESHANSEPVFYAAEPEPDPEPGAPRSRWVPSTPSVPSVPAVPSVPSPPSAPSALRAGVVSDIRDAISDIGHSISRSIDGSHVRISYHDDGHRVSVEYDGEIEFGDDDRSVVAITDDGYLEIEERRGRDRKRLLIEPTRDGLDYLYYEDGRAAEFDSEAQEWAGDLIEQVIRESGIGAEKRVERIREEDGVEGVLEEISRIESDYVKRIYVDALLESGPLSDSETDDLIELGTRQIDSDYEKAELLIAIADHRGPDFAVTETFVDATASISSDYETRRVLSAVVLDREVPSEVVEGVLEIAAEMDSDYEKAELLIDMSPHIGTDTGHLRAYLTALRGLDSDFETRRVLNALGLRDDLEPELAEIVLEVAMDMDSDFEKAELLIDMAAMSGDDEKLMGMYLDATATISSDYEQRRVLSALSFGRHTNPRLISQVLDMLEVMDSDYDKAEYLTHVAAICWEDSSLRLDYIRACAAIGSDYDRKRALNEVLAHDDLDRASLEDILRLSRRFNSDYERAQVLEEIAGAVARHPELEDEYLDVIESMSSQYERDRLYRSYLRGRPD
ncbi:hypothetical protein GF420_08820 [candidate division GN15 bacterium]|nr:hypothetical protein [candidate division GN15 bacterium]